LWETDWRHWPLFEPHHYLTLPKMIAATNYVATVNGQLVTHLGMSTRPGLTEARTSRLVVMPEWQVPASAFASWTRFASVGCAGRTAMPNRCGRYSIRAIQGLRPRCAETRVGLKYPAV
jgi:hypothetical protein